MGNAERQASWRARRAAELRALRNAPAAGSKQPSLREDDALDVIERVLKGGIPLPADLDRMSPRMIAIAGTIMRTRSAQRDEVEALRNAAKKESDRLKAQVLELRRLVPGSDAAVRSAKAKAAASKRGQRGSDSFWSGEFSKQRVAELRRLCHPDKHDGSDLSKRVTQWLNRLMR